MRKIEISVTTQDIEDCHRVGKSKNNPKKTFIPFSNQKYAQEALLNRKYFSNIDKSLIGLSNSNNIFINEKLTSANSKLAVDCRKLKRDCHIEKRTQRDGSVYIRPGKVYKILYIATLFDMFPDFDFGDNSPATLINL